LSYVNVETQRHIPGPVLESPGPARSDVQLIDSQDESSGADAKVIVTDALPRGCSWAVFPDLVGPRAGAIEDLLRAGGVELDLAIPNEDPTTYSMWLVEGRDVNLL
jgi:hypothetical protein